MRAFLTGGNGFVGGHLRDHLVASGDRDVTPVDRVDITDEAAVTAALRGANPDVIYHLAARTSVAASLSDATAVMRTNVVGTQTLLDVASTVVPEATVVVVSSSEVYGLVASEDQPTSELHPSAPRNPYASSKVEVERVAHAAAHRGQRIVIARPFTHVGPGQSTTFVVPALVQRLLNARAAGADTIVVGNLAARRDLSDVRDVVRAYRLLALLGDTGEIYNVASGHDLALEDVASELRDLIHPGCTFTVDPALLRPLDVPVTRGDATKLHDTTGWEPRIGLGQTLRDTIEFLVSRFSPDESR